MLFRYRYPPFKTPSISSFEASEDYRQIPVCISVSVRRIRSNEMFTWSKQTPTAAKAEKPSTGDKMTSLSTFPITVVNATVKRIG